jgi:hypothetical protein
LLEEIRANSAIAKNAPLRLAAGKFAGTKANFCIKEALHIACCEHAAYFLKACTL